MQRNGCDAIRDAGSRLHPVSGLEWLYLDTVIPGTSTDDQDYI